VECPECGTHEGVYNWVFQDCGWRCTDCAKKWKRDEDKTVSYYADRHTAGLHTDSSAEPSSVTKPEPDTCSRHMD